MRRTVVLLLGLSMPGSATADVQTWVRGIQQEAALLGVSNTTLVRAFETFQPLPRIQDLDRKQPESTETLGCYVEKRITLERVRTGRQWLERGSGELRELERRTGVPSEIVLALWGLETNYGKNMGSTLVVDALGSLAYEGRRTAFFRKELLAALQLMDRGGLDPATTRSSWAGALGHVQFMPSTYLAYAVDGDGDGLADLWNSRSDAWASAANYLRAAGWRQDLPWGSAAGLVQVAVPDQSNQAVLMKWNRSTKYATAVVRLAESIAGQEISTGGTCVQ